jgi:hypothetical protein
MEMPPQSELRHTSLQKMGQKIEEELVRHQRGGDDQGGGEDQKEKN